MSRPSVLVTRRLPGSAVTQLDTVADVDMHDGEQGLTREQLHERLRGKAGLVVLLGDRIDKDAIDAGEALRVVANVAVGYDNLDVAYAVSKGIAVTNTPDVLTDATADMTWALILAVTRRLGEGERIVRGGRWRGWAFDFMLGSSLAGKQLGIVGGDGLVARLRRVRAPSACTWPCTRVAAWIGRTRRRWASTSCSRPRTSSACTCR